MKVYLIRHAQSVENVLDLSTRTSVGDFYDLLERSPDAPITPEGVRQARMLAAQLRMRATIARLYSSPFTRALSTAAIIGEAIGLTPQVLPELREVLPQPARVRRSPRRNRSLRWLFVRSYLEMLWPYGEGESWMESYRRIRAAWRQITAEPAPEVAVVAHRATIWLILLSLRRDPRWKVVQSDLSNSGISIAVSVEERPVV